MELQVELLKMIQQIRFPLLDVLFQAITITAEELFFIVLAAWFLWCGNKQLGYRVGFAFLVSSVVNPLLKNSFRLERPIGIEGIESQRLHTAEGFAFPSGHTQGAAAFWTGLMSFVRRPWMYRLGGSMIVLVALSRMYLGVHWPMDVLGGAAAGILTVLLMNKLFDLASRRNNKFLLLWAVIPLSLGLFLFEDKNYVQPFGALLGFWLGFLLEERYIKIEVAAVWWRQGLKMAAAVYANRGSEADQQLIALIPSFHQQGSFIRLVFHDGEEAALNIEEPSTLDFQVGGLTIQGRPRVLRVKSGEVTSRVEY